jgi:hypothetical protein
MRLGARTPSPHPDTHTPFLPEILKPIYTLTDEGHSHKLTTVPNMSTILRYIGAMKG